MDNTEKENIGWELFTNCAYTVVAVIDNENHPYCIPISPVVLARSIYFHTSVRGKLKSIFEDKPFVTINCVGKTELVPERFTTSYASAIASGFGEVLKDNQEKMKALEAICIKYASSNLDNFDGAIERSYERTAVMKINVETIMSKVRCHR